MTLNLVAIEPLKAGCGNNVSPCLSECAAMVDPFALPPDFAAAEIFQSAMSDGGADFVRVDLPKSMGVKVGVVGAFVEEPAKPHAQLVGSSVSLDRGCVPLPEVRKTVGREAPIAPQRQGAELEQRNARNYTECKCTVFDRGVTVQESNTTATDERPVKIVNASESGSKAVSKMQDVMLDAPVERALPEECEMVESSVSFDRGCVPLPEVRKTVGREAPIAPPGHDGVAPMRRHEDAPPNQSAELQPRNTRNYTECKVAVFDRGVAAQEANTTATDERPVKIVIASESGSKAVSKMQDVMLDAPVERALPEESEMAGSRVSLDRGCVPLPEVRKTVGREAPIAPPGHDGVAPMRRHEDAPPNQSAELQPRNTRNYTECKVAVFDRGVAVQEANTTAIDVRPDKIVNASESGSKAVSKMQEVMVNAPIERALPEECEMVESSVSFDRGCVPLPEERRTVWCEAPIAPPGHDGVAPMRRHEDAPPNQSAVLQPRNAQNYTEYKNVLPSQNIVKPHEMPSDGNEPILVIAPAPLPIELPASVAQQQSAAAVATHDVVKMFVAAAEAVADAILVSSGFENGEGRILVRLQPEVLGGSEIQITVKGGTLTVVVNPASQDVQTIVEANRTQFEQHLAEKVHSWRVAVAVRKGDKIDERV